jgi:hypothetical protein
MSARLPGVTVEELFDCWFNWGKSSKVLRFGQFLISRHMPQGSWPELFHECDSFAALEMAFYEITGGQK